MDEKAWVDRDSKILGCRDIVVTTAYLSRDYLPPLDAVAAEKTTSRGRLLLMTIEPKDSPTLPRFCARWDHEAQCVDIDFEDDLKERRKFKYGKAGYRGHQTLMVTKPGGPRAYAIDIETPITGPVFKGILAFKADFALNARAGLYVTAGFEGSAVPQQEAGPGSE
jgi:hypothetical protein